jgi:hypothetical protein
VACETATKTGMVMVFGEITTAAKVDYEAIVRKTCRDIGFTSEDVGLDADTCKVLVHIEEQSPDIGQGVHGMGTKTLEETGAGDQGHMFGYATVRQAAPRGAMSWEGERVGVCVLGVPSCGGGGWGSSGWGSGNAISTHCLSTSNSSRNMQPYCFTLCLCRCCPHACPLPLPLTLPDARPPLAHSPPALPPLPPAG